MSRTQRSKSSRKTLKPKGRPKLAPVLDFTPLERPRTIEDQFLTIEMMLRILTDELEILQETYAELRKAIEAQRPGREAN